jgi:DNA recombination protein RmuC
MEPLSLIASVVSGAVAGAFLAFLWLRGQSSRLEERAAGQQQAREQAEAALALARAGQESLSAELARARTVLEKERQSAQEKQELLQRTGEEMSLRFKQLSQEILEDKSRRFAELNQLNMEAILTPLREKIAGFEQQVKDSYDKETRDRVALFQQIRSLQESNQKVAEDARNLAVALKGQSKTQGNWGEMILERLLELSGLTRGREYETQFTSRSEEGRQRRPDAIVHLPDNRDIVIDAKVSLTAYVRATEAATDDERARALIEHVASVRTHLQSLSAKEYQNLEGIRTLDFVLMFVPNEAAYIEAVRAEPRLFEEALARNVGLVSPSSLMPTLRTVENLWRFERQSNNARDIADRAGKLYDKFAGLIEDMDKIGRALETTDKAYKAARNKLVDGSGSLVGRVEELKALGAKTSKQLPRAASPDAALPQPGQDATAE